MNYFFSSESVSEGHPDKIADQISDAILDAYLQLDPFAKVACECLITSRQLIIAGEVKSEAKGQIDPVAVAKNVLADIGYDCESTGFDFKTANYLNLLHEQSAEINQSVQHGGAGDQGLMFGYACRETESLMPLPISIAHQLMAELAVLRKTKHISWLLPDAKSQVTIKYQNGRPTDVDRIVLSTQHQEHISQKEIRETLIELLIKPVLQQHFKAFNPDYLINPSGIFTIGGPHGDTGLTGRKIIVDTYGGSCPHGGGAFSGKDPSKVDRSGAYAARYVAKHLVSSGLAERCTIQVSYAIGKADPTSLYVYSHGTGKLTDDKLTTAVSELFDLTPNGIAEKLTLRMPIYLPTAKYGHFGKEYLPWEIIDQKIISALLQYQ